MKDVIKILLAILIVWVAWKIIKGILGLLVGIVIAGLVVYAGVKLLEGGRRG